MRWLFALVAIYSIFPMLCVSIAAFVARNGGCRLDEAGAYPCQFMGVEVGETIAALGLMGWLTLFTVPTGAIALAILAAVQVYVATRYDRESRQKPQ